jgi:hypothetical protein
MQTEYDYNNEEEIVPKRSVYKWYLEVLYWLGWALLLTLGVMTGYWIGGNG